jgi:hypothetical protein
MKKNNSITRNKNKKTKTRKYRHKKNIKGGSCPCSNTNIVPLTQPFKGGDTFSIPTIPLNSYQNDPIYIALQTRLTSGGKNKNKKTKKNRKLKKTKGGFYSIIKDNSSFNLFTSGASMPKI